MNEIKVSVIVPVYNLEKYLKRCVDSLISQNYENLEILLIDDGSVDQSGSICEEYARKDTRIRVVHKENGGLVSAWIRGAKVSAGDYLCFVDGDDWIDENMISEMALELSGIKKEIISSDYVIEREGGNSSPMYQGLGPGGYDRETLEKTVFPDLLGNENRTVFFSRCMKLISRDLIVKNMKYCDTSIRMGEDVTIILPALLDCERLVVMDHKTYYHYFYVSDSMVHKYDSGLYENIQNLRRVIGRILQDKVSQEQMPVMLRQADKEYLLLLFLALKNEARGNPQGYYKNIMNICTGETVRRLAKSVKLQVAEKANRLLYLVLKHPNCLTIRLLRAAMLWYYR